MRLRPDMSGFSTRYGLSNAGAVWTGTITVMPSTVTALGSDGPAPPRRLSTPAFGSASRTPKLCNSLISCSVGRLMAVSFGGKRRLERTLRCEMQRTGRTLIELDADEFGTRVMADGIHHSLALDDEGEIEVGEENALAVGQRRDEVATLRRDDRGHVSPAQAALEGFVRRDRGDLGFGEPACGVDDEAAAFERVMADRHLDLFGEDRANQGTWELRGMDLLVLRHQRIARERIVVLPAGERAYAANRSVDNREPRAVALAPDHPLVKSRRDLAPLQLERAVGVEHELGVVKRAVIALVDSEHDDRAVLARRRRDPIGLRAGRRDGVLIEADMLCPALDGRRDKREVRVPGNESLGENDELGPLPRRFVNRRNHPIERRRAGRQVGRDLHRRGAHLLLLCHRVLVRAD